MTDGPALDVITIGRSSVDLYGAQVGGRLEDMASFKKYIGGSPTNIAAGSARLGLKSAVITRVGDEHMGRFIREQLAREGVDVAGVKTDPERLTALVLLGIRDDEQFPLIFYRENCADMAICEDDIDPAFIARTACVTATGTHLSHPRTEAAVLKALRMARNNGARTALDIDYRPNLWGLAGHGAGEERFIESAAVTARLQTTLPLFDLIVGTEEEFHIAGGSTDTLEALRTVRAISEATLVCKRGSMGAVAFEGEIGTTLEEGISGPGFPIEVFNVLGAGDGFMSGLLRGWLRQESWETALTWANACGAFAVSRHGCAPAYPSWEELQWFLQNGSEHRALRHDAKLEHIHWATNRRTLPEDIDVFDASGCSPKQQVEIVAELVDATSTKGPLGVILGNDARLALFAGTASGLWVGRRLEADENEDIGSLIADWPVDHTLVFEGDDDETTRRVFSAARAAGLEVALDVVLEDDVMSLLQQGITPDWWVRPELKPDAIRTLDPWCRGGLKPVGLSGDDPLAELKAHLEERV